MLIGLTLNGKWKVVEKLEKQPGQTGGNFSVPYIAEAEDKRRVFVKAIDITKYMLEAGDQVADRLLLMTRIFTYERDLLEICKKLSRIVTAIDSGTVQAGTIPNCYEYPVFFLVFELASGDARSQANVKTKLDLARALRSLHHVVTGMQQLHRNDIAHQDLKPSNVLFYIETRRTFSSKIADVGRALKQGVQTPYDGMAFPGDPGYAPPELLYREIAQSWELCRLGADLYLLGSLVTSFFTGVSLTSLIFQNIKPEHRYDAWTESYEAVLPYVRHAFEAAISENVEPAIREQVGANSLHRQRRAPSAADELVAAVRSLCDPDLKLRGHPVDRRLNQHSLERYVSMFDRLATAAEIGQL